MNPQEMMFQMLMSQLKTRNPQMYQTISQARSNGVNPQEFIKQMTQNSTPEQMQQVLTQAQQFGVPSDILAQVQNNK